MARKLKQVDAEINSKKSNNLSGNKENNYDANLLKTREVDIEKEVKRMYNENKNIFKGKTILFPCNDVNGAFYKVFVKYGCMFDYDKCIFVNYKNNRNYTDIVYFEKGKDEEGNDKYTQYQIDENRMKEEGIKWNGDVFNDCDFNKYLWDNADIVITNIGGDYKTTERDIKNIWKNIVNKEFPKLDKETKKVLVNRFALGDKSVRITKIYNKYPSEKEHISSFDKNKVDEKKKEINNDNRFVKLIKKCIKMNKQFLIVGSGNAITYKEIFPLIKENKIWLGFKSLSGGMNFIAGDTYDLSQCKNPKYRDNGDVIINVNMCSWFTNLKHNKRDDWLELTKTYSKENYPKYDNYDAIHVDFVRDIPIDYDGVMGVPCSFLDKYNPNQFEIVGLTSSSRECTYGHIIGDATTRAMIDGKKIYARILIRHKR